MMPTGETNIGELLKTMSPTLHSEECVVAVVQDINKIHRKDTIFELKEAEGTTVILERRKADALGLEYGYVCCWITLNVHYALAAVGFTAAFSAALAAQQISCNVVAGYYHDHIFVAAADADNALLTLTQLAHSYQ